MPTGIYKHPSQCGFQKGHKINAGKKYCLGNKLSTKHKIKIATALKGHKFSDETKEKIRESMKGKLSMDKHWNWKGGKIFCKNGYIKIKVNNSYLGKKQLDGYVYEHRLIAEKCLGRYLKGKEVMHHINEIKIDNRPQNLYLFLEERKHKSYHKLKNKPILISNIYGKE